MAPTPLATIEPGQSTRIVGTASGRCLEVPNSSTVNGAQTQLWDCHGSANQTWTWTSSKQLMVYGNRCLDAYGLGSTDGTAAVIWDCNGQTNQQWNVNANGTITGVHSGLCLDASGYGTANGTRIHLWTCHGGANQQWTSPTTPPPTGTRPCDLYASGGTPCVAAHSTTRALYAAYAGYVYQVRRSSDNTTRNIGPSSAGGTANAATQDSFCAGTTCVVTVVFDQSGRGNDLWYQGSTVVPGSPQSKPAIATSESLTVGGAKAYSLYINPGNSYWRDGHLTGVPTGAAPEGMYMVTSGTHVNNGCCFDYGNSETTRKADAAGAMDAINFGTQCWFGGCSGTGPWVQADIENCLSGFGTRDQMVGMRPPSMTMSAPVTFLARPPASSNTRSATSSGRVNRPVAVPLTAPLATSAGRRLFAPPTVSATPPAPSQRSVSTGPGLIVLTRTPRGPTSFDNDLEKFASAAFAAL